MKKRRYVHGGAAASLVLAALLLAAACPNPSGGDGEEGKTTLTVSGTVNPADLAALGLKPDETAVLEFYSPQGEKIAEAQIAGDGGWSAEIAPAYKDSEITVTLLVSTEDGDRIFECGKITMGTGGGPVIEVLIPGTADEYTIGILDPVNGVFTVSRVKALKGELITVSAAPATGYKVRGVTATGDSGGLHVPTVQAGTNSWTFTMPPANVTVLVEFIPEDSPPEAVVVDAFSLDGLVTAPVRETQPDTRGINTTHYTGTVYWQTEDGTAHNGPFAPSTVYKAVVTLTAKTGYTFTGVAENSFTYTGASVSNAANSGTVTITFPATAASGQDTPVSALSLDGLVTAPVTGGTPNTTGIHAGQYTGTVYWQTGDGTAHNGPFASSTVYKAVVTLTAKTGYTFSGVTENSFTYTGASVSNAADSGTVTITFPATAASGGNTAVNAFSLDGLVTAPVTGGTPNTTGINAGQYTGTVTWQTGDGTAHSGPFAASTVYRAVLTLVAKTGYTFSGVGINSFTYTGAVVANAANSGTVTITFPATESSDQSTAVTAFSLDGLVTAPVKDAQPVTTGIDTVQYMGTIAWQTGSGTAHSGSFAASTVYKAIVTLTAKTGYTFDGVGANSFTCADATSVNNAANSGTVTITFPATGSDETPPAAVTVSALVLDTLVTAPVRSGTPDTTGINTEQYTGTIAWQTGDGTAHSGPFAASTVYKAVVTLTAKTGYTFDGMWPNGFIYTGATSVSNAANSGTVTITFPATESEPNTEIPIGNPSVKLYLDGGPTPLAHNGSTIIPDGTGIFTVSIDDTGSYYAIIWYLNGTQVAAGAEKTSISLPKRTAGNYLITVEVTFGSGAKQSGAHTFVVE